MPPDSGMPWAAMGCHGSSPPASRPGATAQGGAARPLGRLALSTARHWHRPANLRRRTCSERGAAAQYQGKQITDPFQVHNVTRWLCGAWHVCSKHGDGEAAPVCAQGTARCCCPACCLAQYSATRCVSLPIHSPAGKLPHLNLQQTHTHKDLFGSVDNARPILGTHDTTPKSTPSTKF